MRILMTAAAAGLTVAAGAGVALAAPGAGHESAAGSNATLRLAAHQTADKTIDLGRNGFSTGDLDLSSGRLTEAGHSVGRLDGSCQVVVTTKATARELCTQTLSLPTGSLEVSGSVASTRTGPSPFDWAIIGGTGAYRTAAGYVHVFPGNRTIRLIVHVTT